MEIKGLGALATIVGLTLLGAAIMKELLKPPEQRTWRTLTRSKQQLVRGRVQLQNQMEALLEEMRIKLSSVISDLLGVSGRRILAALSEGEGDPVKLAQLGDDRLKCGQEALADALRGAPTPTHLQVLLPSGKTGWIPASVVRPMDSDRLCYAKTADGAWKIAAFDQSE